MPLLRVLFLDTSGHPTSAPQYSNSSSKYTIYAHNNQKFGHSLRPPIFFFQVHEGVMEEGKFWWILILIAMSYEHFSDIGVDISSIHRHIAKRYFTAKLRLRT